MRSCKVLGIMNQTNGTGDLNCRGVICLFMRVSIARASCAKADFHAIILRPRLGLRCALLAYITRSKYVFPRLRSSDNRKCRYSPNGTSRSSGYRRIPRRKLSQRARSERGHRIPVIKDVMQCLVLFVDAVNSLSIYDNNADFFIKKKILC